MCECENSSLERLLAGGGGGIELSAFASASGGWALSDLWMARGLQGGRNPTHKRDNFIIKAATHAPRRIPRVPFVIPAHSIYIYPKQYI